MMLTAARGQVRPRRGRTLLDSPARAVLCFLGLAGLVALGFALRAAPATAAFPGQNGPIAFASHAEIYTMDANGQNQTRLTDNTADDRDPAFSPDGSRIAFASNRDGNYEIYVMDASGQNQTRLTTVALEDVDPAFSPDGSQIAFSSSRNGKWEIYVMDADGQNPTQLTDNGVFDVDVGPVFSPDGSKIAFDSFRDGQGKIYVMDANGQNQTPLTSPPIPFSDVQPAFSPDGTKIAFTSFRDGNWEIYVMDADGQNPTRLTNSSTDDTEPDWGPATALTIPDLIDSVEALGLPHQIEGSLLAKLDGAQRNLDAGHTDGACDKLASFISQVEAQSGKKILATDAANLIAEAEAVRESLGCGGD